MFSKNLIGKTAGWPPTLPQKGLKKNLAAEVGLALRARSALKMSLGTQTNQIERSIPSAGMSEWLDFTWMPPQSSHGAR